MWQRFRKRDPAAYKQVVVELAERQHGLCLYCEQLLVDKGGEPIVGKYQVEHVLPKSGASGRVLDWTNLALACWGTGAGSADSSCGRAKGDRDLPARCDPRVLPLLDEVVDVGLDGNLSANVVNCQAAQVSPQFVEDALGLLNLRCERLRKRREDASSATRTAVTELLRDLLAADVPASVVAQAFETMVASRLSPDPTGALTEFWSAERSGLGAASGTWISRNLGMLQ